MEFDGVVCGEDRQREKQGRRKGEEEDAREEVAQGCGGHGEGESGGEERKRARGRWMRYLDAFVLAMSGTTRTKPPRKSCCFVAGGALSLHPSLRSVDYPCTLYGRESSERSGQGWSPSPSPSIASAPLRSPHLPL